MKINVEWWWWSNVWRNEWRAHAFHTKKKLQVNEKKNHNLFAEIFITMCWALQNKEKKWNWNEKIRSDILIVYCLIRARRTCSLTSEKKMCLCFFFSNLDNKIHYSAAIHWKRFSQVYVSPKNLIAFSLNVYYKWISRANAIKIARRCFNIIYFLFV